MTDINIQLILNSRFRTSRDADRNTIKIMEHLGLSTKASVARLAISRSLAMGKLQDVKLDAKGLEIPATSLFSSDDVAVWIGVCIAHSQKFSESVIRDMDGLREAIRRHWHRGVELLLEDWVASGEDYDRFLNTLINRRAELPDLSSNADSLAEGLPARDLLPVDISDHLVAALKDISVSGEIKNIFHGPRVTRYKVFLPDINMVDKLRKGLERLSLVLGLQEGLPTLSRGDESKTVYLDIPRLKTTWESCSFERLKDWSREYRASPGELIVFPGVDVMGNGFTFDLAKAPHLLVGGATGQGKSICLHALIASLILKHSQESLSLALIDPKQVEFAAYKKSKYLYNGSVAVGIDEARDCILNVVAEMDRRYDVFQELGVSNIEEANSNGLRIKYIVVFIEELADLVLQDRDLESQIVRLAQLARAAGIHLVLATQRPDSKTFSGLIRSNIPARIALTVQKSSESKIILDETGAEHLLGSGDMLVKTTGKQLARVHGVYVTRSDIESLVK